MLITGHRLFLVASVLNFSVVECAPCKALNYVNSTVVFSYAVVKRTGFVGQHINLSYLFCLCKCLYLGISVP